MGDAPVSYTTPRDMIPTVTIGFNRGREAQIAEGVLDTRRFQDPGWLFEDLTARLPKSVAVSI